jgi:hypothetical protein
VWQDLDGCSNSNISPRLTSSRNSRCPTYKPFARTRLNPFDMKSLVFFLYFLILQASGQSPVVVTTTSGELHGSELDGGEFSTYVPRKFGCSDSHSHVFQRSGELPALTKSSCIKSASALDKLLLEAFDGSHRSHSSLRMPKTVPSWLLRTCIQQFPFATSEFTQFLFNNPPPASENEDCLFLYTLILSFSAGLISAQECMGAI